MRSFLIVACSAVAIVGAIALAVAADRGLTLTVTTPPDEACTASSDVPGESTDPASTGTPRQDSQQPRVTSPAPDPTVETPVQANASERTPGPQTAVEDPDVEREVIRKFRRLVQGHAELAAGFDPQTDEGRKRAAYIAAWEDRVEPAWDRFAAEVRAKVPVLAAEMSEGMDLEPDPPELTDGVIYAAACHAGQRERLIDNLALAVAAIPDADASCDLYAYELANSIAVSSVFKQDRLWRVLHDLD